MAVRWRKAFVINPTTTSFGCATPIGSRQPTGATLATGLTSLAVPPVVSILP